MTDILINGDVGFVLAGNLEVWRGAIKLFELRLHGNDEARNPQQVKVQTAGQPWDWNDPLRVFLWTYDGSEARIRIYVAADLNPIQATSTLVEADPVTVNLLSGGGPLAPNTAQRLLDDMIGALGSLEPGPQSDALATVIMNGWDLTNQRSRAEELDAAGLDSWGAALRACNETPAVIGDRDREVLFPRRVYSYEEHARLIDMRGNRNAIFSIGATELRQQMIPAETLTGTISANPHQPEGGAAVAFPDRIRAYANDVQVDLGMPPRPTHLPVVAWGASVTLDMARSGSVDVMEGDAAFRYDWSRPAEATAILSMDSRPQPIGTAGPAPRGMELTVREVAVGDGRAGINTSATERQLHPVRRYIRVQASIDTGITVANRRPIPAVERPDAIPYTLERGPSSVYDRRSFGGGVTLTLESKALDGSWSPVLPKFVKSIGSAQSRSLGVDVGGALLPSGRDILRVRLIAGHAGQQGAIFNDPTFDGLRGLETVVGFQRVP